MSYGVGGRGANQAIAAALTGTPTELVGCVGDDSAGASLRDSLAERGVGVSRLSAVPGVDSGSAHITVGAEGSSASIVPAANLSLNRDMVAAAAAAGFDGARVVVAQGEIPVETVEATIKAAARARIRMVLHLSPAVHVSARALRAVDVLVLDAAEAAAVLERHLPEGGRGAGADDAGPLAAHRRRAAALTALVPTVVVTLGARGSVVAARGRHDVVDVPATRVAEVLDPAGAGDAFVGVLAAALARRLAVRGLPDGAVPGLDDLVACVRVAGREAARVLGRTGAAASYTAFSLDGV
ncbi:PfkB family carbohydrate kinase [Rothia sp. AR01]|uniref:PfkB family carbohydrate kinase n=1 Tax=Rothia santali TaxID=2949643 RepID=A0A9X2HLW7_9MICC|nr:PfkB family carbohydrate kinase [Rothia santali]MCP3426718.1 PfkB family carbohydrate kinase [Rothia santali]